MYDKDNLELGYLDGKPHQDIVIQVQGTKIINSKNSKAYKIVVLWQ